MKTAALCPVLWNGFAIGSKGDVHSCCHIQPTDIGNIHDTDLRNMVNMEAILRHRKASLEGRLHCFSGCNLRKYDKPRNFFPDERSDYDKMTYLHLFFGERCNISCIMCKVHENAKTNKAILTPELLIKRVDLTPFNEIIVQGGEPLFIPECREYLAYLASIKKKYILLSNGVLIDDRTAQDLAINAMRVCVSLNAASRDMHNKVNRGSDFNRVIANLHRLRDYREELHTDLVIHGRMTITVPALPDIPAFIKKYKDFAFDRINFGYDMVTVPGYLAANPGFAEKLSVKTQDALVGADLSKMDLLRLEQLGLVAPSKGA
jgi:MoaA/NifB/PqqE/SkfB family radical SAM enzyme